MTDSELDVCEVCGDDLCPGCIPEVRVPRVVWLGLASFVAVALGWRGIELLRTNVDERRQVTTSSVETGITDLPAPSTSLLPSDTSTSTVALLPTSTSSTSLAPPAKSLGPLDHPLLQARPAALWFWQPSCSLCADEAEYLPQILEEWSSSVNFVSVPINGDLGDQIDFLRRYGIVLPTIDDKDGRLSSFFEITETPTWGLLLPDGDYKTLGAVLGESQLKREVRALARTAPMAIIDTSSESAVRSAYQHEFGSQPPPLGWTGSVGDCNPGSTSKEHQAATLSRVNWYRAMAGVEPRVKLNDEFTVYAQAAALTMYASGRLDHEPDSGFRCMTRWSSEGAGKSNLHLGVRGPEAIDGYIEDEGANNTEVGHRRWILLPELTEVGTGDTPGSNALMVIGGREAESARTRERELVMWPPRGYVPRQTIFPRWSVSSPSAFSGGAHVLVKSAGRTLVNETVQADTLLGWPTLVFEVPRSAIKDRTIEVTIFALVDWRPGPVIVRYEVIPLD